MNSIFSHPFFMVGYASITWFVLVFTIAKSRNEHSFNTSQWLKHNWDDFLLTIIVGAALVIWDDELLQAWNDYHKSDHPLEFKTYFYLLPGPLTDALIRAVKSIKK